MLVRIDDFPTGVRAREADDLERFRIVLDEFETREIPYTLGVVPYICSPMDFAMLNTLSNMEVAVHGFSHNHKTWHGINTPEFSSFTSASPIVAILKSGMEHISNWVFSSQRLNIYIPPFNQLTQLTVEALKALNFTDVTSGIGGYPELDTSGLNILRPRPQFYGRSWQMMDHMHQFDPETDHLAFHLTWEADLLDTEDWKLPELLDKLCAVSSI